MTTLSTYQQPIGAPIFGQSARPLPSYTPLVGLYCRLELLDTAHHADTLFAAFNEAQDDCVWTYMAEGPFTDITVHRTYTEHTVAKRDPLQYAVIGVRNDRPVDTLALVRIIPEHDMVEVGAVIFSPLLQHAPASTEVQFLLMKHIPEDPDYQCYEWRYDSLNAPSRWTAQRLGFQFEGIFRQAVVYRGRSRDAAWLSIIDAN